MQQKEKTSSASCPSCGGVLLESLKNIEHVDRTEETFLGRCISCGMEFDSTTAEYYRLFGYRYFPGREKKILSIGLEGEIDDESCTVNGYVCYLTWKGNKAVIRNDWQIEFDRGTYAWICEESCGYILFNDYHPSSINLDYNDKHFEFEGEIISKRKIVVSRVILTEGYLRYGRSIGEEVTMYKFTLKGIPYRIVLFADSVRVLSGERISCAEILYIFMDEEFGSYLDDFFTAGNRHRVRAIIYGILMMVCLIFLVFGYFKIQLRFHSINPLLTVTANEKDDAAGYYINRFIYGPIAMPQDNTLCKCCISSHEGKGLLKDDWIYITAMLVKEEKAALDPGKVRAGLRIITRLTSIFDTIYAREIPLEDFAFSGALWNRKMKIHKGDLGRSKKSVSSDFVLEKHGNYYLYTDVKSVKKLDPGTLVVTLRDNMPTVRYPVIAAFIFMLLCMYNLKKSRGYETVTLSHLKKRMGYK